MKFPRCFDANSRRCPKPEINSDQFTLGSVSSKTVKPAKPDLLKDMDPPNELVKVILEVAQMSSARNPKTVSFMQPLV